MVLGMLVWCHVWPSVLTVLGGVYFSNHYYLGHKKFDTGEPEVFLFGDLQDINYLPVKPIKVRGGPILTHTPNTHTHQTHTRARARTHTHTHTQDNESYFQSV